MNGKFYIRGLEVSEDTYKLNQGLATPPKVSKTEAQEALVREQRLGLVREFEDNWRILGGPELKAEKVFDPTRKWSADYWFVYNDRPYLIEIDGGVWSGGRHTRGAGFIED